MHLIREHYFMVSVISNHILGHTILKATYEAIWGWLSEEKTGSALSFLKSISSFHLVHLLLSSHLPTILGLPSPPSITTFSGSSIASLAIEPHPLLLTASTPAPARLSLAGNCSFIFSHASPHFLHPQRPQNVLSEEQSPLCHSSLQSLFTLAMIQVLHPGIQGLLFDLQLDSIYWVSETHFRHVNSVITATLLWGKCYLITA